MPHFAYLDPATGTLIISAVVGFFAAAALLVKNFWYKIKGVFGGKQEPAASVSEPATAESHSPGANN